MTKNIIVACACLLMFASTATAQTDFREALRIAFPATVSIDTGSARVRPFGGMNMLNVQPIATDQTGFVVGSDLIASQLTSDIEEVTIQTADKETLTGKVVVRDYVTGLAIIRVNDAKLVSLVVGAGNPEAGLAVVITRLNRGTPSGAMGMIASGPTAAHPHLGFTQLVSATVHQSDVGAPVVDAAGVVVGVIGSDAEGSLLCLPTAQLMKLIDVAGQEGAENLKRGIVGVAFADGNEPVVKTVTPDSPAAVAGFEVGDRVTKVGEFNIETSEDVLAAVGMARAGDDVVVQVERGDETIELKITLKEHPRQEFVLSGGANGGFAQQAWELRNGKLVPLNQGGIAPAVPQLQPLLQRDFEKMFENFPNRNFILPNAGGQPDGSEVERSDLEDSIRDLEQEKSKQADELKDIKQKLRDLQDKPQGS